MASSRDSGGILLDMNSDQRSPENVRHVPGDNGESVAGLYVSRVGAGHMRAVVSVVTIQGQSTPKFYHDVFRRFKQLSRITIELHAS